MTDALTGALAEALAELVTAVATCDDEVLDPDIAVKWLESTGHTLAGLPAADRRALDGLFREVALRRPEGPDRDELLLLPETFGLGEPDAPDAASHVVPRPVAPGTASAGLHRAFPGATSGGAHPASPETTPVDPGPDSPGAPGTDPHAAACDAVAAHALRFAAAVRGADPATPVPTCPGWTLADLTRHLGAGHRWAEHLVWTRATVRVRPEDVPLDLPAEPAAYPDWLVTGAGSFAATLRAADPDGPVWSPGADPRVRSYPRRLLRESLVHLADAEIALGGEPGPIDPLTAADAVDHLLADLPYIPWTAEPLAQLDRDGAVIRLAARDADTAWTLTLGGGGFTWARGPRTDPGAPAVQVEGGTGDLLLLLHRRYAADDPRFDRSGDADLLDAWLAATAL
ncbi:MULTISPECIES: maleylpyruvate isomerase N-terminal domain-containing protein [unclassified Streptomyces]|uniref:maleylpyruvate isomerase N-terminal domain-containing protein n=1 Tax=unclassified Streptomyces TaxID=2593676 RepID=UPI00099E5FFD|nr:MULTISPECIES: maleylpyruvate isomerase N-terminal domain-containing protein [unclassified Streptomyces]